MNDINAITDVAQVAANIECLFWGDGAPIGYDITRDAEGNSVYQSKGISINGQDYVVLDTFEFENTDYQEYPDYFKGAVIKSKNGDVFFHFNGTGDGNWGYNAAAYGLEPQPSILQQKAAEWFDEAYTKLTQPNQDGNSAILPTDNIYVTGHSQGGNNAMYVTMLAKNADKIDLCVPLDGSGFSDKFVADTKEQLGVDYYKQTGKIWAFNGEYDYVSILGQNSIVPEGHTKYIKYSKDYADFACFHGANGLINDEGKFLEILDDDSEIRKRLASAVNKVKDFPQEDQEVAAKVIMALCENYVGDDEPRRVELSAEEFDRIKPALVPVIIELLAYNPEKIAENLQYILGIDNATAQAIANLIIKFDSYPVEIREKILTGVLTLIKIENGKIDIDTSAIPSVVVGALPILAETIITNPTDIWTIVQESEVDKAVGDCIKDHPWETVGIIVIAAITAPLWFPIAQGIVIGVIIIDIGIRIVQGISDIIISIKEEILNFFDSVKATINAIKEWFDNKFNKGTKYAEANPYFKADTDMLNAYASRLASVNSRLKSLDGDMRSLYWQVGFLDLWDILCANLITSESYSLNRAIYYLTDTAERLSSADSKARAYLEG